MNKPKNHREVYPRTCNNCKYWVSANARPTNLDVYDYYCIRDPEVITGVWPDYGPEHRTCDGYKKPIEYRLR